MSEGEERIKGKENENEKEREKLYTFLKIKKNLLLNKIITCLQVMYSFIYIKVTYGSRLKGDEE